MSALEAENSRAYSLAEKWERSASESSRQCSSLSSELGSLKKKRDEHLFELENLQEDMDTMTENCRFLQKQNQEYCEYNRRLEDINAMLEKKTENIKVKKTEELEQPQEEYEDDDVPHSQLH